MSALEDVNIFDIPLKTRRPFVLAGRQVAEDIREHWAMVRAAGLDWLVPNPSHIEGERFTEVIRDDQVQTIAIYPGNTYDLRFRKPKKPTTSARRLTQRLGDL